MNDVSFYTRFLLTFEETTPTGPPENLFSATAPICLVTLADLQRTFTNQLQHTRDVRLLYNIANLRVIAVICCDLEYANSFISSL